tara:strand:+ start:4774 stop:5346 length:573 start_codon:yes stop_codon:yes gene_type:complete
MNITLPILLLVFGGLTFWILNESKLKWYIRTALIASFCSFTILFYTLIHTFLGWAADQDDIPEKIAIHWVIIKEPNKILEFEGKIYVLIESAEDNSSPVLKFFGYKQDGIEPRLHEMDYTRELHEQLQKLQDRLSRGQPVLGTLQPKEGNKGKKGDGEEGNEEGDGSESQKTQWEFHELRPSDFLNKPTD